MSKVWKPETMEKFKMLATRGFTEPEICKILSVSQKTLLDWKRKDPEFFKRIENWKNVADDEIERSLFERARGYVHPETKVHWDTELKEWMTITIDKYYPPDSVACFYWLKNRRPERWKDKHSLDFNLKTLTIERKRFDGD